MTENNVQSGRTSERSPYEYTRIVPSPWVKDTLEIYNVIDGVEIVTGTDVEVRYGR